MFQKAGSLEELQRVYQYLKAFIPDLSFEDLAPLAGSYRRETFRAKETVFSEGESYRKITFILSGLVKKYYLTNDGKEFIKEFAWEGQVTTPYASILRKIPATYTMEALEDLELLVIEYGVIESLFKKSVRWLEIGKALADFHFLNREDRELELLKYSADERYAIFKRRFPELIGRLKKKDIASYLGITPVSLSRLESDR
jgi:CRP-like cAMP-binding protein